MTQREITSEEAQKKSQKRPTIQPVDRGVYISTYGCQMNVNDTERMYTLLEMANYVPVDTPEEAEIIIINACSVREKPVHKVYSEVGTYRVLKNKNKNLKVGVAGCVGQQEKENLIKNQPMIDFVFGTDTIDQLPQILARIEQGEKKVVSAKFEHREPYHIESMVRAPGAATFVNIMKGCDNFCTFCIVPFTRGREKSRPLQHVLTDIRHLVKKGTKEVTLLGQNVNSYKSECGADFADLLEKIALETGVLRIRFTSPHPKDFNEKVIQVMAKHRPIICDSLHMPLQAGNSRILELMNRGYTKEDFLEKVKMIREYLPQVAITTDIIVGFPGETEEDFLDTLDVIDKAKFDQVYAFKYSPRPFTKAAKYEDQVPEEEKSQRLERLFERYETQAFEDIKVWDGRIVEVLVEKSENGKLAGRNSQNKLIHFMGPDSLIGQIVPVKITKAFPSNFRGELVQ